MPSHPHRTIAWRPGAWMLLALAPLGACAPEVQPPRSALIVTLDTTRADAVGAYGRFPGLTPRIDAIAKEGVLYERAYTVAPLTLPAHATLLSGLLPPKHGVRVNGVRPLPDSARTLAEVAHEAGLRTAAFVGAVVLHPSFGLDQGFEVYDSPAQELAPAGTHYAERRAIEVVDAALEWLGGLREDEAFLLWVHVFDPHAPFDPPEAFRQLVPDGNPYLGEIAYADHQLGRLFDALEDRLDETLVMITADHGEGLGQHDEPSHGAFCYDTTMRVPLIVRWPGALHAGERVGRVVSLADVAPTVADALRLPLGPVQGSPLVPAPSGSSGAYLESYYGYLSYGWSPLVGWVSAEGKYLRSAEPEFYAADDVEEARNLYPDGAPSLEAYEARIARVVAAPPLPAGSASRTSAAVRSQLADLGYASAGLGDEPLPNPLEPTDRPAPRARAKEQLRLLEAMNLGGGGRVEEALAILDEILAENPRNYEAVDHRTFCLMRLERQAEAIPALRRVLAESPDRPNTQTYLGICLMVTGQVQEALEPLAVALALQPDHLQALGAMADALDFLGREEEAQVYLKRFRELQEER